MPYKTWHLLKSNQRRRACSFLSNNVKNDVNTAFIPPPCFLGGVTDKSREKKITLHLFKHGSVHRRWEPGGGHNYENYLQLSKIQGVLGGEQLATELSCKSSKHKQEQPRCDAACCRAAHRPFRYQSRLLWWVSTNIWLRCPHSS